MPEPDSILNWDPEEDEPKPVTPAPVPAEPSTSYGPPTYQPPAVRDPYQCWRCGGRYTLLTEQPNKGTGVIVIVLGALLAPICVGLILIVVGMSMASEKKQQWQCSSCGLTLPVIY